MTPRINKLLSRFAREKIDGLLVTREANVSYLSGFESCDAWLLISPKKSAYITDFRYVEEVKPKLRGISLYQHKKSLIKTVAQLCRPLKIKNLGIEEQGISFSHYKKLRNALSERVKLKSTLNLVEDLRQIKEPQEIEKLKKAINLTAEVYRLAERIIKPDKEEREIAAELEYFIAQRGAKPSFSPIVASGVNSAFPHAKISSKKIRLNEPVTVDIGVDLSGYKSDLTRVFFLGKIPLFCKRIYNVILEAQQRAIKEIRPGEPVRKIDALARNYIKQKGLGGFFGHSLGHGVGLEVHEAPTISAKSPEIIESGMVFTIEPGVYVPGKYGLRIEDMVLVNEKGCEVLSGFIHKSN